jgi:hypothetical protein
MNGKAVSTPVPDLLRNPAAGTPEDRWAWGPWFGRLGLRCLIAINCVRVAPCPLVGCGSSSSTSWTGILRRQRRKPAFRPFAIKAAIWRPSITWRS